MTKTYAQIVKQIETLQGEADKLRKKEIEGVIGRIREAIAAYKLTAADLGLATASAPRAPRAAVKRKPGRPRKAGAAKAAGVVKYSNGTGGTWGGRGKRPQWLRDAINSGKKLEDFLVK